MRTIAFTVHVQDTPLHNPMIPCFVAGTQRSALLAGFYKVVPSRQLHGVVPAPEVKQVLTAGVPATFHTTITCVRNATFRHHFRTPCFS